MQLYLNVIDINDTGLREDYILKLLLLALGPLAKEVRSARVRLVDVNGPEKGGLDKCCWIELRLGKGPDVVVEAVHDDARGALTLSATEAARIVARRTKRDALALGS